MQQAIYVRFLLVLRHFPDCTIQSLFEREVRETKLTGCGSNRFYGCFSSRCQLLPKKVAILFPWVEKLNNLFTAQCRKFKFSAQEKDLAPFVSNVTKVKIPSEIKPSLMKTQTYKFIIQLHKYVYLKPNVKISMRATNCMWSGWLSLPDDLPNIKEKQ